MSNRPITVSLVEDDPIFRNSLKESINTASDLCLVDAAIDLRTGLALLDKDAVDILLVDLGLPDGSGLNIIKTAVDKWKGVCNVMVISIFGDTTNIFSAIEAGAHGYLLKDSSPVNVVEGIRRLHNGDRPMSSKVARLVLKRFSEVNGLKSSEFEILQTKLTPREYETLSLIEKGITPESVAIKMNISPSTVNTYLKSIYTKLEVRSKNAAIHEARKRGIRFD